MMSETNELEYRKVDSSELAVFSGLYQSKWTEKPDRAQLRAIQNHLYRVLDSESDTNSQRIPQEVVRVGPKGYCIHKKYQTLASDIFNMELKERDVWVTSYQRSGTTMTQELVWLLVNDFDYEKAAEVLLAERYRFLEQSMFFDEILYENTKSVMGDSKQTDNMWEIMSTPATKVLATMPSPRFIKSHLPMSLLPPKILESSKVVYVARDPRDVAVSCFHHARLFKVIKYKANMRQTWDAFVKDMFVLTPYFEHVKEAWALRDHPNMLFLFYEDLSKDLQASIRKVADFLGKEVSPAQMERLCEHLHIDNFRQNNSVNYEEMRELGLLDSREQFIRKGKSGGWRNYFDEEMTQQAERWIEKNLADTDLRFPSMSN